MTNISKSYKPANVSLIWGDVKVSDHAANTLSEILSVDKLVWKAQDYFEDGKNPKSGEWEYFFMCELIHDKKTREDVQKRYKTVCM